GMEFSFVWLDAGFDPQTPNPQRELRAGEQRNRQRPLHDLIAYYPPPMYYSTAKEHLCPFPMKIRSSRVSHSCPWPCPGRQSVNSERTRRRDRRYRCCPAVSNEQKNARRGTDFFRGNFFYWSL